MEIRFVVAAAAAALSVAIGSAPAHAGLVGAFVQPLFSLRSLILRLGRRLCPRQDCTMIMCNVPNYPIPGGSQNSPAPTAPVAYLEDSLSLTTISVGDTQITITNNFAGPFCPAAGCTPGYFGGYVFTFTGAPDITNVTESNTGSGNFVPVPIDPGLPTGLTWTNNTITLNVAGDNLALNDQLVLDVPAGSAAEAAICNYAAERRRAVGDRQVLATERNPSRSGRRRSRPGWLMEAPEVVSEMSKVAPVASESPLDDAIVPLPEVAGASPALRRPSWRRYKRCLF